MVEKLSRRQLLQVAGLAALVVGASSCSREKKEQGENEADLTDPQKKEIAMKLISSAENSSLHWKKQYSYIEDINDGRGYTAGIIGFCSGTGDMLKLITYYTQLKPDNVLAPYLPALEAINQERINAKKGRSNSHEGLGTSFKKTWKQAATDPLFKQAQEDKRDEFYFTPAIRFAKEHGLHALGQFIYFDAAIMHGVDGLTSLITQTAEKAQTPINGGTETLYLDNFLDVRRAFLLQEPDHTTCIDRIDTMQRRFLEEKNMHLNPPLQWVVNKEAFSLK